MSYDLFFLVPEGGSPASRETLHRYFGGRANYELNGDQAWYSNEDTGVYFSFEYDDTVDPLPGGDGLPYANVLFNINYSRPHAFALEAEPELSAFVQEFNLLVDDPQLEGMGRGSYSREGFLRGWNAGNRFSLRASLETGASRAELLARAAPTSEVESAWLGICAALISMLSYPSLTSSFRL